jgi:hypothetical protein
MRAVRAPHSRVAPEPWRRRTAVPLRWILSPCRSVDSTLPSGARSISDTRWPMCEGRENEPRRDTTKRKRRNRPSGIGEGHADDELERPRHPCRNGSKAEQPARPHRGHRHRQRQADRRRKAGAQIKSAASRADGDLAPEHEETPLRPLMADEVSHRKDQTRCEHDRDHPDHRCQRQADARRAICPHAPILAEPPRAPRIGYRLSAIGYRLSAIGVSQRRSAKPRCTPAACARRAADASPPAR